MKPIALTFWGAFHRDRQHMTLGDILSVVSIYKGLVRRGLNPRVLFQGEDFPRTGIQIADPELARPEDFAAFVFVCGPLHAFGSYADFFKSYEGIPRFALNVSQVSNNFDVEQYFDQIVWRDSPSFTTFDTAIDPRVFPDRYTGPRSGVSVCLVADQPEYGEAGLRSQQAKELVEQALSIRPVSELDWISTVIEGRTLAEIDKLFAKPDVVVTTRLHASLFSIRNETPVISIDQVSGRAKVSAIIGRELGWPLTLALDELTPESLNRAIEDARAFTPMQMRWYRAKAEALASTASDFMCDTVARGMR